MEILRLVTGEVSIDYVSVSALCYMAYVYPDTTPDTRGSELACVHYTNWRQLPLPSRERAAGKPFAEGGLGFWRGT